MQLDVSHLILVLAPDFARGRDYLQRFFAKTQLVRYDLVEVDPAAACGADHPEFWPRLEAGIGRNQAVLAELLAELKASGIRSLDDLQHLSQGYQSKLAHTVAHLLDGFFGIDTVFYNMPEDSHWLSDQLREEIRRNPDDYQLLRVNASLSLKRHDSLIASLRRFGA